MDARLFYVVEPVARGELDELDDVRLTEDVEVPPPSASCLEERAARSWPSMAMARPTT